jgi:hypothetical protein
MVNSLGHTALRGGTNEHYLWWIVAFASQASCDRSAMLFGA